MKNKKVIVSILIILIIGIVLAIVIKSRGNNRRIVSGYSFEISEKDVINKKLDGKLLDSFVTVAEVQEQFVVNLEGINSDSNVFIINPNDGNMIPLEYNEGKFSTKIKLDKDINYGIIMNYNLVGSIRVVEDINDIDEDKLFTEMLISLGCGI